MSAVVLELKRNGVTLRLLAQPRDDLLELILALAADPDRIALDLRLDLWEVVADQLLDLFGEIIGQAAAQPDALPNGIPASFLDLSPIEDLEREAASDRLRLEQVAHCLGT